MRKDILLKGVSNVPSDYDCQDGALAFSNGLTFAQGLIPERRLVNAGITLDSGETLEFVHETNLGDRYITSSGGRLYWHQADNTRVEIASFVPSSISAVGNFLVLLMDNDEVEYAYIKDSNYVYLGSKPPFTELTFGLMGELATQSEIASIAMQGDYSDEEYQILVNDTLYGSVNRHLEDITNDNRFCFPFFVRYAYRMYDGSYMYHSAPVLMTPNIGAVPIVTGLENETGNRYTFIRSHIVSCMLCYRSTLTSSGFGAWADLIKSIDIFITNPVYTIKMDEDFPTDITSWSNPIEPPVTVDTFSAISDRKSICLRDISSERTQFELETFNDIFYSIFSQSGYDQRTYGEGFFPVPSKTEANIRNELSSSSIFYKIASIQLSDLQTTDAAVEMTDGTLKNLTAQETLPLDNRSHDGLIAGTSMTANSRSFIGNMGYLPFIGFSNMDYRYKERENEDSYITSVTFAVTIQENGESFTRVNTILSPQWDYIIISVPLPVGEGNTYALSLCSLMQYLYYPNPNANKMDVYITLNNDSKYHASYDLTEHPGLNGAYHLLYNQTLILYQTTDSTPEDAEHKVSYPSKMAVSDVYNPLRFDVSSVETIGNGSIIAMASASNYMSRSESDPYNPFTAHVYLFTDDGVYMSDLTEEGKTKSFGAVSRAILSSPEGLTRMGNDVAFTTDYGIMVLRGRDSICITDNLNGDEIFDFGTMSGIIAGNNGIGYILFGNEYDSAPMMIRFSQFVQNARLAYDYLNDRLMVYNPNSPYEGRDYMYIFDHKTKEWSTAMGTFDYTVHNWPYEVVVRDGVAYTFSDLAAVDSPTSTTLRSWFITRPVKIQPDTYTTVRQYMLHGMYDTADVYLFGSLDGYTYYPVAAERGRHAVQIRAGSPYLMYRFVVVLPSFAAGQSVSKISIDYDIRQPKRLH